MKKWIFILLITVGYNADGQIDLVQEFIHNYSKTDLIYIDHGMPKLLTHDFLGFQVYNMDFSLYADVEFPVISQGASLKYVTRALFDCDTTQLEYLQWGADGVQILQEDGSVLLDLEGWSFSLAGISSLGEARTPIVSDNTGSYAVFNTLSFSPDTLRMYHFCGQVPQAIALDSDGSVIAGIMAPAVNGGMRVFPNPSSERIQLDYDLEGHSTGRVFLYDTKGNLILEKRLGEAFDHILIDISRFASGTYIAKIVTNGGMVLTEKFVKVER